MASIDLILQGDNAAQRVTAAAVFEVDAHLTPYQSGDTLNLGYLPARSVIDEIKVIVFTQSDATTSAAQVNIGGQPITAAHDLQVLGCANYKPFGEEAVIGTAPKLVSVAVTFSGVQEFCSFAVVVTYTEVGRKSGAYNLG